MATITSYRDLEVWQKSMDFVEDVYKALKFFPVEERYGICDQIRRAVVSIPSNIAEGFGRDSNADFAHFLTIARGSLFEVATQLEISSRLGYLPPNSGLYQQVNAIGKMLNAFRRHLKSTASPRGSKPTNQPTNQPTN